MTIKGSLGMISMTEADTCRKSVLPRLAATGWDFALSKRGNLTEIVGYIGGTAGFREAVAEQQAQLYAA